MSAIEDEVLKVSAPRLLPPTYTPVRRERLTATPLLHRPPAGTYVHVTPRGDERCSLSADPQKRLH